VLLLPLIHILSDFLRYGIQLGQPTSLVLKLVESDGDRQAVGVDDTHDSIVLVNQGFLSKPVSLLEPTQSHSFLLLEVCWGLCVYFLDFIWHNLNHRKFVPVARDVLSLCLMDREGVFGELVFIEMMVSIINRSSSTEHSILSFVLSYE
jgi:hypothetical protein